MKFISLFAGVGGFDLALERLGYECVYANEWDKYAVKTYEKNFQRRVDARDIRSVLSKEIPDHDLLCGGFPCQSFSIAGKRGGFNDTRGTMFFEIARIVRDKRPAYILLENVKGLLSHDNGRTFETILRTIDELGYDTQWQVLNSKNFGVPQNRERVFIIGHLRGTPRPKVFPIGEAGGKDTGTNTKRSSITAQTVTSQGGLNARGTFVGTLRTHKDGQVFRKMKFRRLTPLECERLQGFPDNWTAGVSDTQRYKQMGNAVTVNVVYKIAKRLL